jgi:tetratricopeptide (TPR) repeat protein
MAAQTLSLCVIFKNEMNYLPGCLESVQDLCDEFILVDSGSTDGSQVWAKDWASKTKGAQYFSQAWPDSFSTQRNFALSKVTTDWILFLDADERLDAQSQSLIRQAIQSSVSSAIQICIRNYTYDFQEWGYQPPDTQFKNYPYGYIETKLHRLFRRSEKIRYSGILHEKIEPQLSKHSLPTETSEIIIHHLGKLKERELNLQSQRYEFYEKLASKRATLEPKDPQAHWELGVILQKQRRLIDAEQSFAEALNLAPQSEEIESAYLLSLFQQGKYSQILSFNAQTERGKFFVCLAQAQGHPQHLKSLLSFKDSIHQASLLGLELALRFRDIKAAEEFRATAAQKFTGLGIIDFIEGRDLRLKGEYQRAVPLLQKSIESGYSTAIVELFICLMKLERSLDILDYARRFTEVELSRWPEEAHKIMTIAQKLNPS